MKKVLFVLLALSLFVPVACSKGGDMVGDVKGALAKVNGEVEAAIKELDNVKSAEDLAKINEKVTKATTDFGTAMGELQKKYKGAEPTAEQQQALAADMTKFQELTTSFASKMAEVQGKISGGAADTNAPAEGGEK